MNWSNEKVLKYISAYRDKEVLWNPTHKNYYNRNSKQEAWDELSVEMKCTVQELKKKMDYLLAALRREKAKIKKSNKTGLGAEVYQSTWYPFKYMQFLLNRSKQYQKIFTEQEQHEDHEFVTRAPSTGSITSEEQVTSRNTDSSTSTVRTKQKYRTFVAQKDTRIEPTFDMPNSPSSLTKTTNAEAQAVTELDEYQLYANYLAAKFRTYSKLTYIDVQHQINNLLYHTDCEQYEYRRGYYNAQRYSPYNTGETSPSPQIPTTVENLVPEMDNYQESPQNYSFNQHVETSQHSP